MRRLLYSVWKSYRLRTLQKRMFPDNLTASQRFMNELQTDKYGNSKTDRALSKFLDLCERDGNVAGIMNEFDLNREGLKEIYSILMLNGAGQWVGGHFAAASTIAYAEPLAFYILATRSGLSIKEVSWTLLSYWSGEMPVGSLLKMIGR